MASNGESSTPTWHQLAQLTDHRRARWARGGDPDMVGGLRPYLGRGGRHPDAAGLDALMALHLGPRAGYPVLGDRIGDVLYLLVPPGTAAATAGLRGVRGLSTGGQLLWPLTAHGTASAHWISPPATPLTYMVPVGRLVHRLRTLTGVAHREVAAS